jgi:hypothetical protein
MKEFHYDPYKAINLLKEIRDIVDPAFITFQSAINWVYPTKEPYCINCNKTWEYIEDYVVFDYSVKRERLTCECNNPQITMRNK